jgi:CRISPR type IV-associated protein Csf3
MIEYPPLMTYVERYESLQVQPLTVRLHLRPGARIAGYDPVNLDNLLARAVVNEATAGWGLPDEPGAYRLPVPLKCLWRSRAGLPLWAATQFTPVGMSVRDVAYWHKRAQTGAWTGTKSGQFAIKSTAGRWMERRVPLPTVVALEWQAQCIGNPEEIARLLRHITHVGKRRSNGFGEIERWEVEEAPAFELVAGGALTRPLPAGALGLLPDGILPEGEPAPVGWTPPQWKPALFSPGWWAGNTVAARSA